MVEYVVRKLSWGEGRIECFRAKGTLMLKSYQVLYSKSSNRDDGTVLRVG